MFLRKREYKISLSEEWVNPEETLLDSGSEYQNMEMPIPNSVFKFFFLVTMILCMTVIFFIFDLSIRRHDYFAGISFQNRSVNFSIPPPRGIIFDRLGRPLVVNEPVFDLLAVSKEVIKNENIADVAGVLGKDKEEFSAFVSENTKRSSIFFAASGLSKDQVLEIEFMNPGGFYVVPNTKRKYVDSQQFSQVIGYIGKVSKEDLNSGDYYYPTDVIGRLGIEVQYEEFLRGEHGKIFFSASGGQNNDNGDGLSVNPVIGNSVVLNIDYDMQKRLFNELFNVLKDTHYSKATGIIQDPQTGAVLALVSFPTFDNNSFVDGLSDVQFKNLFENKSRPLFNRTISGLYNPGSTIKPFMGLMTLEEGIFTPSDTIKDCIGLTIVNPYNPDDIYTFSNWRQEFGLFNLKRAIANSCNVYFYIAGGGYGNIKGLGIDRIAGYLKSSFADSKLGIDLPGEKEGFVPTPEWKLSARNEGWYQGDTYNVSIGQGDLLVTPLWLNSYISAIANGGNFYKPFVAKQILDADKEIVQSFEPEMIGRLNFKEEVIRELKNDMLETTVSGTAKVFSALPVKVGAKTGTAEVVKGVSINSILTAFAPFDNPEINITVLIEGSTTNEGLAIRAAYGFMNWYFGDYNNNNSNLSF